jgi:hypothetical protein
MRLCTRAEPDRRGGARKPRPRDCRIVHNSIHDPANRLGRLIRVVHDNDGLVVANNRLSGPRIRNESQSEIKFHHNLDGADNSAWFIDATLGNLHLTVRASAAIDKAMPLPEVTEDVDRGPRDGRPDVGADEFAAP